MEDIFSSVPRVSPGGSSMFLPGPRSKDILHVEGCNHVWAGDLSCETKALVRQARGGPRPGFGQFWGQNPNGDSMVWDCMVISWDFMMISWDLMVISSDSMVI